MNKLDPKKYLDNSEMSYQMIIEVFFDYMLLAALNLG